MAGVYTINYRDGRSEQFWAPRDYYYVNGPDELLRMNTIPAWCRNCDNITISESLQTPNEIELEIKEYEDPNSSSVQRNFAKLPAEDLEHWLARLKRDLAHSLQRKTPPRCLTCGKPGVQYLPWRTWA